MVATLGTKLNETDRETAYNIEELQRDWLIQFNPNAETTPDFQNIIDLGRQYYLTKVELKKHPLFA